MRLFGGDSRSGSNAEKTRTQRHSSGWEALRKHIQEQEGLRVLDIGPTSSTNINLLTAMGHSVYMADLATEAQKPVWQGKDEDGKPTFDAPGFLQENLQLNGRKFDVVLFWDTADYLPQALLTPLIASLYESTEPGSKVLAFSHIKPEGAFNRYHLRDEASVDVQPAADLAIRSTFTNRQTEQMFGQFSDTRFFLAKDNLREILVTR